MAMNDLTIVTGVGPSMAELLRNHGISDVKELANAEIDALMRIPGIGRVTGGRMIASAREALNADQPVLEETVAQNKPKKGKRQKEEAGKKKEKKGGGKKDKKDKGGKKKDKKKKKDQRDKGRKDKKKSKKKDK